MTFTSKWVRPPCRTHEKTPSHKKRGFSFVEATGQGQPVLDFRGAEGACK